MTCQWDIVTVVSWECGYGYRHFKQSSFNKYGFCLMVYVSDNEDSQQV